MAAVDEKFFEAALREKLGNSYERALNIFRNYGERLSYDVVNVLLHAVDKGKVEEVLKILEEHWSKDLAYQHPAVRGTISDAFGVNKTKATFLRICLEVLNLGPTTSS